MPMITYRCSNGHTFKKLYTTEKVKPMNPCTKCDEMGKRQLGSPQSMSTFTVSQGLNKDVEVSHSIIKAEESKIHKGYSEEDEKLKEIY